ncbi:hypothetical protein [Pontibacter liquoris]|uniref:hypothetical protein n=1 Tax=Pontibacter liquoris TaxID=2905677 RepID=UPI001FA6E0C2|nr:hypothetical protein [Pontibacter liquoris]
MKATTTHQPKSTTRYAHPLAMKTSLKGGWVATKQRWDETAPATRQEEEKAPKVPQLKQQAQACRRKNWITWPAL